MKSKARQGKPEEAKEATVRQLASPLVNLLV